MGTTGGSAADILPSNLCPAAIDGCLRRAGSGAGMSVDVFVCGGEKIWAGNIFFAFWMVNFLESGRDAVAEQSLHGGGGFCL